MYDSTFPWDAPLEVADPMASIMADLDMFCDCFLDPDKPFDENLTEEDLVKITEQGFDRWLMDLTGIL